jgi:hypothetical protein
MLAPARDGGGEHPRFVVIGPPAGPSPRRLVQ